MGRRRLSSGLPVFRTFGNCVGAVKAYLDHHAFVARYRSPFAKPVRRRSPAAPTVDALLAHPRSGGSGARSTDTASHQDGARALSDSVRDVRR